MNFLRFTALLGLAAVVAGARADVMEREWNAWPIVVQHSDASGQREAWTGAGPLLFSKPAPDDEPGRQSGLRPLWVQTRDAQGDFRSTLFLYPIFTYRTMTDSYKWSILNLINRTGHRAGAPAAQSELANTDKGFDIWPFWFSRQTGDPATSYHALFPIAGSMKRLGFERLTWVLWPLYFQYTKHDAVTTATPWPFIRFTHGAAHGFALWPLYGSQERPGVSRQQFYLWPLGYNNTTQPPEGAPAGTPPVREYAALPFYAHASGPGYRGETYLWPFFGYTDRTAPKRYHETRYLWPFLVQGRGDDYYVNRWGPFYTHSVIHGYDKTWIVWPVFKELRWTSEGVAETKKQLLYFLYWSRVQHSPTNPKVPPASLTHFWPLVSIWDNGAGRRQWQFPSPLEVFFPGNEKVRAAWTPLFALARHDQSAPGEKRTSLLWNGVTWERHDSEQRTEFHLGPLFSMASHAGERRVALGNGLVGLRRDGTGAWRLFWLDFGSKRATVSSSSLK